MIFCCMVAPEPHFAADESASPQADADAVNGRMANRAAVWSESVNMRDFIDPVPHAGAPAQPTHPNRARCALGQPSR